MSEVRVYMVNPTVISLFAGCGGSSLGYQSAGFRELLAVEWDDNAVEILKLNFHGLPIFHGDIATLTIEQCLLLAGIKVGELDVLDGSPPCQGFSIAGKRRFKDERNSLFEEFVRLLKALQPRVFVMENVPGMIKGCMKQLTVKMFNELRSCGYRVKGQVINAMYYGVPQSRQRVIMIGVREDLGVDPSHPKPQAKPITAFEATCDLPRDDSTTLKALGHGIWKLTAPGRHFSRLHPKGHWFNACKVDPNKPAPTITKTVFEMGAAGLYHWEYPRALNIAELKRLASFPDEFQMAGSFQDQWARIGNSVPPMLMKAIAGHIKERILKNVR
ncbi:MAG: DNA cytosine methyltransferase [Deltaproteobacteria bacterium]|nr:DNA cytosine methyltransferase [Deltaproteobacteria bacterium]